MKFRYKKVAPGILRPIIPIQIFNKNKSLWYEVLIDSGADNCIFDTEIGQLLGLNIKKGKKLKVCGITGEEEDYYIHRMKLSVGGLEYNTNVGFLQNIAKLGYGVVGQLGFFDKFVIRFDLLKEKIELKPRLPQLIHFN